MRATKSTPWILIFVIYFLVHALIRTALGWQLTADEAALMQNAQSFEWLYGQRMPLYIWLQSGAFQLFGETVLAMTLLKNVILFLLCMTIYRLISRYSDASWALATTLSLIFVPQLVWTSQHTLTSPVLATLLVAVTLLIFTNLVERPSLFGYLSLGLVAGLGAISSVHYLWAFAGMVLAGFSLWKFRFVFKRKAFVLSLIVAVGIATGPYYHFGQQQLIEFSSTFNMPELTQALVLSRSIAIYEVLQIALAFAGLLIIGAAMAVYKGLDVCREISAAIVDIRDLLVRTFSFSLLLIFAYVFATGDAEFTMSALQPVMFLTAPIAALYILPVTNTESYQSVANMAAGIALLVLLISPAHYSFSKQMQSQAALDNAETMSTALSGPHF